ncbi:MAG: hypothetical protein RLZZ15_1698, partial [Verrucomicrobiota bacterium]
PLARVAATALKMPAEGSTAAYKTVPAFGGVGFEAPVQVVYAPGETTRAFVVERAGRVAVVRDTANPTREIFLDLTSRIGTETSDHGLLTAVFHPSFATNGFFYLWYSIYVPQGADRVRANRLARFKTSATNPAVADLASETPILTQITGPGGHDGGTLLFGPDGYLYLSIGDGDQNVPEIDVNHQRIDRAFFGGVLRLDVDQKPGNLAPNPHASVHAGTYLVPADNPFVGATTFNGAAVSPTAVRTEFWAVGLRNPWRMAFDSATGQLWCADVGLATREEINLITRGANYGWEFREGLVAGPRAGPAPVGAQFTDPIWDYGTTQGFSITGGFVYRGAKFPDLVGSYLFSDYVTGRLWALVDNGARPLPATQVRQLTSEVGLTGFALDPRTGDILLADHDSNLIRRLALNPNANGTPLPATLADTGAFSNLAALTPAPGVVAYAPNVSFWSDYAQKSRWFALPDTTSTFGYAADGPWSLPAGAVWIKHFDLELRRGDPTTARRVETRLLVKTADGLYGASYQWNAAQTNATLVANDGATQDFTITETDGKTRTQKWTFPSRENCLVCHTEKGGGALTFNTRQMHRAFPANPENQIAALARAGYFSTAAVVPPAASSALADPLDPARDLTSRARAYLDANCAQCHQPGGTAFGAWDARSTTPLSLAGIVNGRLLASGRLPEDRVIVPGSDVYSVLLRHVAGVFAGRMPPVGSNERDLAAESLLSQWIADLAKPQPASRLLNLAARASVGTDADVLIPGFVIGPGAPKTVLIRAVGPTLGVFGVGGALASPVLTLFDSDTRALATNTRWDTAANAAEIRTTAPRVGAFSLPAGSADSAVLATLAPGAYTAQTAGANSTTGVALVEIYDADASAAPGTSRLINTAVRAQVGTGASVLIPGLVVSDGAPKTVLIRAVGPTLAVFGVGGTLAEPVVTLFAGAESFLTNRGWNNAANAADIRATASRVGAFALAEGSKDSVILASLSPGAYTIQVSGAGNTTGVALVEVYEVP